MRLEQRYVDGLFDTKLNEDSSCTREFREDCITIVRYIRTILHVELSVAEAANFWSWRSNQWEASWMVLDSPKEVAKWFVEFVEQFYKPYTPEEYFDED